MYVVAYGNVKWSQVIQKIFISPCVVYGCLLTVVSFLFTKRNGVRIALKSAQETNLFEEGNLFHFISNDKLFPPLFQWTVIFPYNSLYTQSCRIHHVFWAWELLLYRNTKWRIDYTARHGETSRVFLDMVHFWPEFYLQMGNSFNI